MGHPKLITLTVLFIFLCRQGLAQTDSLLHAVQQIPGKYFSQVDKKIDKYSSRLTSKTVKTLTKFSRWENRIHSLLQKASPESAERLFANKDMTFAGLLEKLQQGRSIAVNATAPYNEYRDKLSTSLKYIQQQKSLLAFPSNSFYKEPRADSAIRSFCQNNYHISFPLAAAGPVIGSSVLPVYGWLADSQQNGTTAIVVLEDFQKILLDRDGALIGIFSPSVEPSSPLLVNAITGN